MGIKPKSKMSITIAIVVFIELLSRLSSGADKLKKLHNIIVKYPSNRRPKKSLKNISCFISLYSFLNLGNFNESSLMIENVDTSLTRKTIRSKLRVPRFIKGLYESYPSYYV